MKNFEQIMDNLSNSKDMTPRAMELPEECKELYNITEHVSDTMEKTENLKDMMDSGNIQMSWTKINTSNSCGCNNACFNSCFNIG